ncbi:Hypothetical predicted protein [Octopus vulgaris]|uniref:ZP domain-containing protein n=1 Tax=Octopus vulgaris TaxID=6645 RepID=A0AA36FLV5_OCTVU|nr:Hypothetical predicted protein [Octopus vulgaris]
MTCNNYCFRKPPGNIAMVDKSKGSLTVVEDSSTRINQDLPLGKSIRLQAEVNGTGAVGVHVTSCKVSPSPGKQPVLVLLDEIGCSTDLQILEGFHGINKDGSIAQTNLFQVFKFTTSNTLYFTCKLDFCYVHGDPFCSGHKPPLNRDSKPYVSAPKSSY